MCLIKDFGWIQYLESVNTAIRYIKGKENVVSVFISWNVIRKDEKWQILIHSLDIDDLVSYKEEDLKTKQYNE